MQNQPPEIELLDATHNSFNLSIASARTCYSSRGIIYPESMDSSEKAREIRDKIARSTRKAGHLTTRQHPQFIFALDKVSRQLVWSFFHSHPFYNSEQVSQRYVEVGPDHFHIPMDLADSERSLFLSAIESARKAYFDWFELLKPYVEQEYFAIYKSRAGYPQKWQTAIHKKCLEISRYFLPLATHTYLYHTVNGLTLRRYHRLLAGYQLPAEQKMVIEAMVAEVQKIDPLFIEEFDDPIALEDTPEYQFFQQMQDSQPSDNEFIKEFDEAMQGQYSQLVGYSEASEKLLADSIRAALGQTRRHLADNRAIEWLLAPQKNSHLVSTLNETSMSILSRCLNHVQYTFQKKISHTADSQDQRHRMVPGSRPLLMAQYNGQPDYITPAIIAKYPPLQKQYSDKMAELFDHIDTFARQTANRQNISYLLPNAFPVRFYESGNLLHLYHKWKSRLCYNAQEEIFNASQQEVMAIARVHPQIGRYIAAPCGIRKVGETKPYCPEGDRYCGVRVWQLPVHDYSRTL